MLRNRASYAWILLFISAINCEQKFRLSTDVTPLQYDLHIRVDLQEFSFNGTVTIVVYTNIDTTSIEMHQLDLDIEQHDVQVIWSGGQIEVVSLIYNNDTQIMKIVLGQSLIYGRDYRVTIKFAGAIKDDMKGLYRSSYYENGRIKYIATTFSAAAYARKIFPCMDEPQLKAKFHVTITNKDEFNALSNMKHSNITRNKLDDGEWKTTTFKETPVMSTYLLAFAVVDFKNITNDDGNFKVFAHGKVINDMNYALEIGEKTLKALEDFMDLSYQLDKMDFIAIDDFLMGAMENWGFISYKSSRILNPAGKRNRRHVQDVTTIITHELIHQFFGNEVTCEYWDYVWLNEGFATYLENVIADKVLPGWRIIDQFLVNQMHAVMQQDVAPKTHSMTRPITTIDEISRIYDFVVYPKAASVIRMIEHIMTPEIFQKALKSYITERSYKTATDEQLFDVLQHEITQNSELKHIPIAEIFRSWSHLSGFPILNVEFFPANKTVLLSQEQFVSNIGQSKPSQFFIAFNFATPSDPSDLTKYFDNTRTVSWIHTEPKIGYTINELKNDERWIIFNVQQTGYYRVNYDERNWRAIIDELNSPSFERIHHLNRAQLLDDSFNLARAGYLDFAIVLDLIRYLHRETELAPLTAAIRTFDFILTTFDEEPFYHELLSFMMEIVDKIYANINNSSLPKLPSDVNYTGLIRLKLNLFACRIGAKLCLQHSSDESLVNDMMKHNINIEDRPHFYCGMLHRENVLAPVNRLQMMLLLIDWIQNEESYRENQDEINEALYAMTICDGHNEHVEMFLQEFFINVTMPELSKENAQMVIGNLIKTSIGKRNILMKFYAENFAAINKRVPLKNILENFAQAINSETQLQQFNSLASYLNSSDLNETVIAIEENIRGMQIISTQIKMWVENEKSSSSYREFSIYTIVSIVSFAMLLQ